jgi:excinuclease UvrABC nuclease subunit
MRKAAGNLEFEKAALIRDQIVDLRKVMVDDDIAKPAATPAR